ncbi:MAG TPA: hypothetical protein VG675_24750 [Bryobacteraceae bacterium]|nr:hypothetical protein [Bryobacteraceae bacterium]
MLKALPTFILVILLHFFLKSIFFKPMGKVLQQRYELTEGARKRAAESLARADAKTAEYDAAIRTARAGVYQAHEQLYKQLQEQQRQELQSARERAEASLQAAKAEILKEVEQAKSALARDGERLAEEIAESILRRSAA